MTKEPGPSLSATQIASMHRSASSSCDLALRLVASETRAGSIPSKRKGIGSIAEAQFARGNKWESHLAKVLEGGALLVRLDSTDPQRPNLNALMDAVQNDEREIFYVTGLILEPPDDLYATRVRTIKPDFLLIDKSSSPPTVTVIDAKASGKLKVSHQIQIALYATVLKSLAPSLTMNREGIVWLCPPHGKLWPESVDAFATADSAFSIASVTPILDQILNERVVRVMRERLEALEWGIGERCEECEFAQGCTARARAEGDVSLVGGTMGKDRAALRYLVGAYRNKTQEPKSSHLFSPEIDQGWNQFWIQRFAKDGASPKGDLFILDQAIQDVSLMEDIRATSPSVSGSVDRLLALQPTWRTDPCRPTESPVLKSALHDVIELKRKPSLLFPRQNNCAIHISLLRDPETNDIVAITFLQTTAQKTSSCINLISPEEPNLPRRLIRVLSGLITSLTRTSPPQRVQFYTFSSADRDDLSSLLLSESCTYFDRRDFSALEDAQMCLLALLDSPAILLAPIFPPRLLNYAAVGLGSKLPTRKADLEWYLRVLQGGESVAPGTIPVLKERIKEQVEGKKGGSGLPRVVVLKEALREVLAFPRGSRGSLEVCAKELLGREILSVDEVYGLWKEEGRTMEVVEAMKAWTIAQVEICSHVRRMVQLAGETERVLVSEVDYFRILNMKLCEDALLSRLVFCTQYEMVKDVQEIQQSRLREADYVLLEYIESNRFPKQFHVLSEVSAIQSSITHSNANASTQNDFKTFQWLLVDLDKLDAGKQFNDLKHMDQVHGLKFIKAVGLALDDTEKIEIGAFLAFAHVEDCVDDCVTLSLDIEPNCGFKFTDFEGGAKRFALMKRYVDWNTSKLVRALVETEVERLKRLQIGAPPPLFLRLLGAHTGLNAEEFFVRSGPEDLKEEAKLFTLFKSSYDLIDNLGSHERPLHFLTSQHKAVKMAVKNTLSIVWGPPGNGKTHTLALTALRLIEINARLERPFYVIMTAFTHEAIDNFLEKVVELWQLRSNAMFAAMERSEWVNQVHITKLQNNNYVLPLSNWCIFGGTVWSIWKLMDKQPATKGMFHTLIIDEGSQFLASHAALVFPAIDSLNIQNKRVIVAGDELQLGPILRGIYPQEQLDRPVYGSILACLLRANDHLTQQLNENFRFVTPLCKFTEQLYTGKGDGFDPQRGNQGLVRNAMRKWNTNENVDQETVLHTLIRTITRTPLGTILLQGTLNLDGRTASFEDHIRREVTLVTNLAHFFTHEIPTATVFLITPHRLQRNILTASVRAALPDPATLARIRIDTVERMQGRQADIVILCLGFTSHADTLAGELAFVYDVRRVNVALSRAKCLCLLVSCEAVFRPPAQVLETRASREGFLHLMRFREASEVATWSGHAEETVGALVEGVSALNLV
ncbi:hypothetical protein BC830DRAFT_1090559 [Chytriomyces sp. MP71]|nr:hypothetical protein BC830DRAFT_1090559 [Chytriomyces sp. MP71]